MKSLKIGKKKLKPIKIGGLVGYRLGNIQKCLKPEQYSRLRSWLIGQTLGDFQHEPVVYIHDFERFMRDLPVLD
mgnify:FL=1